MDDKVIGPATQPPESESTLLRSGSLGLPAVVALGLAYMSLAPIIYFNTGFMESEAGGPVMPFVFIMVTLAMLPTALSFAVLNNKMPNAGSATQWLARTFSPAAGLWGGWLLASAYIVVAALYPAYMMVFFNPFLSYFGIGYNFWTGAAAGVALVIIGGLMIKNNIQLSARTIAIFMVFEAGFVLLLSIYIVIKQGGAGNLSLKPFTPSAAASGNGLFLAVVYGVLSLAGVDGMAPVAEEAKTPRRLIPIATVLVTLATGAYVVFCSYAMGVSVPTKTVLHYVDAGLFTPVYPIAGTYIGGLKILVPLTAWSASLASFGAAIVNGSRILYAMSREGNAPPVFARLDKNAIPWNAALVPLIFSLIFPLILGVWLSENGSNVSGWVGGAFVFFILVVYVLVNFTNLVYHLRYRENGFNWFLNGLVPVLGVLITLYLLYKAFFQAYWGAGFQMGNSIVIFPVIWAIIGLAWVAWKLSRRGTQPSAPAAEATTQP